MAKILFFIMNFLFCFTISVSSLADNLPHQWFWNQANHPGLLMTNYNTLFDELPLKGNLSEKPWSGDYWATYLGGISYRWYPLTKNKKDSGRYGYKLLDMNNLKGVDLKTLSPAEKYDLYIGDTTWGLTNWERKRTGIMKIVPGSSQYISSHKIPAWFGLCHNWAPATLLFENPGPIKVKGKTGIEIPFGSSDIKALLDIHLEFAKSPTKFLGSRCNISLKNIYKKYKNGEISKAEYEKAFTDENCTDTNAGSFHVTVANMIGRSDTGFVLDVTRGDEVWNQAAYGYDSVIKGRRSHNNYIEGFYITEIITIETSFIYIGEVEKTWEKEINPQSFKPKKYLYDLFIDYNGNIVGGNWLTYERPDFLWTRQMPQFNQGMAPLEILYKEAVGEGKPSKPKRSGKELLKLFKKTVKKIMLAQKFIKNSKELVAIRKEERKKQLEAEKRALKKRLEREERERLKRLEEERRSNKKFKCVFSMYRPRGKFQASFVGEAVNQRLACQMASRDCHLNTRGTKYFCVQGNKKRIFPLCVVQLIGKRGAKVRGTFKAQGENVQQACQLARQKCQDEKRVRVSRAPNRRRSQRRAANLICKKDSIRIGPKVLPNRGPSRPLPPNFRSGVPPRRPRPGMRRHPVAVDYPTGTISPPRSKFTVNAGPLWNHKDAEKKCPRLCRKNRGQWSGGWWTTVPGKMSVCQCQ